MSEKPIIIIGAGPSVLMAAQKLAEKGYKVQVYEQNKAAARKFLVAGHGGFNLTHSESIDSFVEKYDSVEIQEIVRYFDNQATIQWLSEIGIETYVGSSGKIFPAKHIKPIQVLKAWLLHLENLGVEIHYEHIFVDFNENNAHIKKEDQLLEIPYSKLIIALGGGSWKKTGSDAKWITLFQQKNIKINTLQPANSGYNTGDKFHQFEGQFIKNVEVSFHDKTKLGEIVFTNYGIEGSPIYYMNRFTRPFGFPNFIHLDLKPHLSELEISEVLDRGGNISSILKNKLKLSSTAINILRLLDKETYTNPSILAKFIKKYPIEILDFRPIDEVISTAGGICFSELNKNLELKNHPNIYCAGEMLDWEAPTGGYLLQACFSIGVWIADDITQKLN